MAVDEAGSPSIVAGETFAETEKRWNGYISEVAVNRPTWTREQFEEDRVLWHERNGLSSVLFDFPWGDGEPPRALDTQPEEPVSNPDIKSDNGAWA